MGIITLENFYRSKEWERFRPIVIAERTDPETGFVRCAYCGKPILKKYDLILHHKTELTDANVNDAAVALNPDNIECVHFRCHNAIHERFVEGHKGTAIHYRKKVFIVYGAPCSGKTTFVHENASAYDLVVDIDSIWESVSNNGRYIKPNALKQTVFGIRDKLYDDIKYRSGNWRKAFVLTGGARLGDRERLVSRINANELIFVDASKDECLKRSRSDRPEGWEKYINDWFESYQPAPPIE